MIKKEEIFPIGIGTWKIDPENFDTDLKALVHSYEVGQNYLSLYMLVLSLLLKNEMILRLN